MTDIRAQNRDKAKKILLITFLFQFSSVSQYNVNTVITLPGSVSELGTSQQ